MPKFFMIAAVGLLSVVSSYARLGETLKENVARYGKVKQKIVGDVTGDTYYVFSKSGYNVIVGLGPDGKAWQIGYSKKATDDNSTGELSSNEIENFLSIEKGDGEWKEVSTEITDSAKGIRNFWDSQDRKGRYMYNMLGSITNWHYQLDFCTYKYDHARIAAIKAEENKAQSGF